MQQQLPSKIFLGHNLQYMKLTRNVKNPIATELFFFRFGDVPSKFEMDDVKCTGTEVKIEDCPHKDVDDCGAGEGAGVVCTNDGKYDI